MSFLDLENGSGGYQRVGAPSRARNWDSPTTGSTTTGSGYGSFSTEAGSPSIPGTQQNSPEQFERVHSTVHKDIERLSKNVSSIQRMLNGVGTQKDSDELRTDIRNLIGETRLLVKDTNQGVRLLGSLCDTTNPAEKTKRKRIQGKLTKDFQTWLGRFQDVTKLSARKERDIPIPSPKPSTLNRASLASREEEEEYQLLQEQDQQRAHLLKIENEREFNEMLIQEREEGIREIESTVLEVNEIFQDLGHLVVEQGIMIDSIENHIEDSVYQTTQGVQELRKASDHQRKARTKMCLLVVVVIGVAIAAVGAIAIGLKIA